VACPALVLEVSAEAPGEDPLDRFSRLFACPVLHSGSGDAECVGRVKVEVACESSEVSEDLGLRGVLLVCEWDV